MPILYKTAVTDLEKLQRRLQSLYASHTTPHARLPVESNVLNLRVTPHLPTPIMTGPARPPSTQPSHCSEDDYTHTFASDSSFYSAGDWIGSLPTGAMTPLHHASSVSGSEIYMPATFDPREANTFLIPVRFAFPYSTLARNHLVTNHGDTKTNRHPSSLTPIPPHQPSRQQHPTTAARAAQPASLLSSQPLSPPLTPPSPEKAPIHNHPKSKRSPNGTEQTATRMHTQPSCL